MNRAEIFSSRQLAPANSAPLYLQVKRLVRDAVENGALKAGDALPSERAIAHMLKISRVTIRNAFGDLVQEGVLVQKRGSGTYVNGAATRIEQPLSRLTSFTQDMALRGIKTEAEWLERSQGPATPEEAMKLSLSPGEPVSRIHRLRRADGAPLALEHATLPAKFLRDLDAIGGSLYAMLEAQDFKPVRALQHLHAVALSEREAALLEVKGGSPALHVERISYLADGRIVEWVRSLYRGDRYDFVAELTLPPGGQA
jgi:GntR family transcriptional regulator